MADINIHTNGEIRAFIQQYEYEESHPEFWTLKLSASRDDVTFFFEDISQIESSLKNIIKALNDYLNKYVNK